VKIPENYRKPRSACLPARQGLISITVGRAHGNKTVILANPEGVEYHIYPLGVFNPFRVVKFFCRILRGLHPRLLKFNSFRVVSIIINNDQHV